MSLSSGTRLGPYEILSLLGEGGMGEVWKARDTRLDRTVAIKVSKEQFNERFDREARAVAALNHPNICQLYDVGPDYLVMEFIDGPTLADRLTHGALPLEEALPIARHIAEALEAAHDKGITHRDLKPANIKVSPDGVVKVLDFGLAKSAVTEHALDPVNSPTIIAATIPGVIMGTAGYMSPEQASGRPVDRRADIWSFGVVLWEMLCGRTLFEGETLSHTLADVLRAKIDLNNLPAPTPSAIRRLLSRCLERDRKKRLQAIGEARISIEDYLADPTAGTPVPPPAEMPEPPPSVTPPRLPWVVAGLSTVTLAIGGIFFWRITRPVEQPLLRLHLNLGPEARLGDMRSPPAISPDGAKLVYSDLGPNAKLHLWVRRMNQPNPILLAGTENAFGPFFSPEGRFIGFFADGKLKKVGVDGGAPITLCDAPDGRGGSWSEDGSIAFTPAALSDSPIMRVSSAGGTPAALTQLDSSKSERTHRWPQILPGGKALLFTAHIARNDFDTAAIEVMPLAGGRRRTIHKGGTFARYVPSGHIIFVNKGTLFAIPFDPAQLAATGAVFPALEEVVYSDFTGSAQFDIARNGSLLYLSGKPDVTGATAQWLDASGSLAPIIAKPGPYFSPRLSPDGTRLALRLLSGGTSDIWIYDLKRETNTRLTFGQNVSGSLVWHPGGRHLFYRADEGLFWIRADGSGKAQLLAKGISWSPKSISPDGKWLAGNEIAPVEGDAEQWRLGKPEPIQGNSSRFGTFSPDGRWLAYASDESGRNEVYVRPFPGKAGKWQISIDGGTMPVWPSAGRELFFRAMGDGRIMAVPYDTKGESFVPGKPRLWSPTVFDYNRALLGSQNYDITSDGKRFVVLVPPSTKEDQKPRNELNVLLNFFTEIRRRSTAGEERQ